MIRITNKSTNQNVLVSPSSFYKNELEQMIYSPQAFGNRNWSKETKLFFNIPNSNSMKSKSQMRDYFRLFKPSYELFLELIKKGLHPIGYMSDNPHLYNKQECMYLYELDNKSEIYLGQHLDCISVSYEPTSINVEPTMVKT